MAINHFTGAHVSSYVLATAARQPAKTESYWTEGFDSEFQCRICCVQLF